MKEPWILKLGPVLNNRNLGIFFLGSAWACWMLERPGKAGIELLFAGINFGLHYWLTRKWAAAERASELSWKRLAERATAEVVRLSKLVLDYQTEPYVLMRRDGRLYKCYEVTEVVQMRQVTEEL